MGGNYRTLFNSLLLHFRPRTVPERTLQFNLTWGLGGSAAVLVLMLFCTGILLKFVYQPFIATAYESIIHLQQDVPFGRLVRNVHHWSANLLLVVAFLHLLRVFFTGAYHVPRRFNWIIGLSMFLMVMASNLTGYLMPWDQLAFWAVTIVTGMLEYIPFVGLWMQAILRGGSEVGTITLSNFYALHTAVLPVALMVIMPFHFWRIRKAGGLVILRSPDEDASIVGQKVPSMPNLLLRELVVALVVVAAVLLFSVFVDAPLLAKANSGLSLNPVKAPWYFAGMQEMLMYFHPLYAVFVIPLMTLGALFYLPYIHPRGHNPGVWFVSPRGRRLAIVAAITAGVATPLGIIAHEILRNSTWPPSLPPVIVGLISFGAVLAAIVGFASFGRVRYDASRAEIIQSVFVLLLVVYFVLTINNVYFRIEGMKLMWW
jgi:quinol-cytochrome oxidoreductase complex cytochrome b subunit